MSDDKRSQQRRRALKDGRVLLAGSRITYDCAIRDMSETGARIRLQSDSIILPEQFELVFVADGLAYPATRKWRRGNEYGVAITGAPRKVTARYE
jgi:two-component system cell cycle response regulator